MTTDTTPECRLTTEELAAIPKHLSHMKYNRLVADAQLAKADAWWGKREDALKISHREMLEMLVQLLEEVIYPFDKLMPTIENIIARAESIEEEKP